MSDSLPIPTDLGFAPGTIIGDKYRVEGVLGVGGMGVVLSALHLELGSRVAIKVVRQELARNEEAVSRLLFEARAVARMRGTHIVRVLDVARLSTGAPYVVMERLEGADLQALLTERGPLSPRDAVGYLLQACEGLAEAHGLGIIHRDLKPENLFLANTPEGVVLKILDFGISKDISESLHSGARSTLTGNGSTVGSPFYMSPEQMRASPNLDARADIWSLGAILFELVTGRCPFEEETPARLCARVMVEEAPSLSSFSSTAPAELDAVVHRCLQKEPSARYQSVTELAGALRAFLSGEQGSLRESTRLSFDIDVDVAVEPPHNPRKTAGLALLGLSALLVITEVGSWQLKNSPADARWLADQRAATVETSRHVAQPIPKAPEPVAASPQLASAAVPPAPAPALQVASAVVPPAPASPQVASAVVPPAAPALAERPRTVPAHAPVGPLYYIPPVRNPVVSQVERAAPVPDSPEARYGL